MFCHNKKDFLFCLPKNMQPGIFEFGFGFAEIFDQKVQKIRLPHVHHIQESKF